MWDWEGASPCSWRAVRVYECSSDVMPGVALLSDVMSRSSNNTTCDVAVQMWCWKAIEFQMWCQCLIWTSHMVLIALPNITSSINSELFFELRRTAANCWGAVRISSSVIFAKLGLFYSSINSRCEGSHSSNNTRCEGRAVHAVRLILDVRVGTIYMRKPHICYY